MKRLFATLTLVFMFCVPAFALSDAEFLKMKKDSDFREADKHLNRVYKEAQNSMTKSDFEKIKSEQSNWIKSGRDEAAKKLLKQNQAHYSKTEAYTEVTLQRAKEIYGQIPYDLSLITADDFVGTYESEDYLSLVIWWKDEKTKKTLCVGFNVPRRNSPDMFGYPEDNVLEAEFDYNDEDLMALVKYESGIEKERNLDIRAKVTMLSRNKLKLEASPDLKKLYGITKNIFIRDYKEEN